MIQLSDMTYLECPLISQVCLFTIREASMLLWFQPAFGLAQR